MRRSNGASDPRAGNTALIRARDVAGDPWRVLAPAQLLRKAIDVQPETRSPEASRVKRGRLFAAVDPGDGLFRRAIIAGIRVQLERSCATHSRSRGRCSP